MNIDESISLQVQGEQSNSPGTWTVMNAMWQLNGDAGVLSANPSVPGSYADFWTYNPVNSGTGHLIASYPLNPSTQSANIPVNITGGTSIKTQVQTQPPHRVYRPRRADLLKKAVAKTISDRFDFYDFVFEVKEYRLPHFCSYAARGGQIFQGRRSRLEALTFRFLGTF